MGTLMRDIARCELKLGLLIGLLWCNCDVLGWYSNPGRVVRVPF